LGDGAVFSVTPSGTEKVLHSFGGPGDGVAPEAGLVAMNGVLYGTTLGGVNGTGTVFSITPSGTEKVLYSFGARGSGDGQGPYAGLIAANGVLYGTTIGGGANNTGTVFSITPSGTEKVVYSFGASGSGDGAYPQFDGVIAVNGVLYGTTIDGGANGNGVVFSVTPSGSETVLHSFGAYGSGDGANPQASLTLRAKTLYGTTSDGGATGQGAIFSLNP
jgi:uncharacterized repeat protein (TIGR03803 family)